MLAFKLVATGTATAAIKKLLCPVVSEEVGLSVVLEFAAVTPIRFTPEYSATQELIAMLPPESTVIAVEVVASPADVFQISLSTPTTPLVCSREARLVLHEAPECEMLDTVIVFGLIAVATATVLTVVVDATRISWSEPVAVALLVPVKHPETIVIPACAGNVVSSNNTERMSIA